MQTPQTADEILAVRPEAAAALLGSGASAVRRNVRRLIGIWHPDVNSDPRAGAVVSHLVALRDAALGVGATTPSHERLFVREDGTSFNLRHRVARPFDAGEVFVTRGMVVYRIDPDLTDLAERALAFDPPFADAAMRTEMERFLPSLVRVERTTEGLLLAYRRTPDQILAADLPSGLKGVVPPVHLAWMISGMQNIAAWLSWAGLVHGAIAPETLLVSPLHHSVALTGPMLYLGRVGATPTALPERTLGLVPRLSLSGATLATSIDGELVRLTARELSGDPGGARLSTRQDVPRPLADWLMLPAGADDYASWERARDAGFGPRRFVQLTLTGADIYGA